VQREAAYVVNLRISIAQRVFKAITESALHQNSGMWTCAKKTRVIELKKIQEL